MSTVPGPPDLQRIAEFRQQHIGRLLWRSHRAFSIRSIEKLRRLGHEGLSLAHTNLLAHLDVEGTRITVLAERAGITKQAMGQLVTELEQKGYIARSADPADRRATLIAFTEAGWKFLNDANRVKHDIEAEYTAILGGNDMDKLRDLLTRLLAGQAETESGSPD